MIIPSFTSSVLATIKIDKINYYTVEFLRHLKVDITIWQHLSLKKADKAKQLNGITQS